MGALVGISGVSFYYVAVGGLDNLAVFILNNSFFNTV